MKKGMRYYLGRNIYNKKNEKDFLSLDRIEDLFSGFKQMLSYLVEDLTFKKKEMEALGIMQRNQIEKYVREECFNILKDI
jgi:hypothetical protein